MEFKKIIEGKSPAQQVTALKTRRNCAPSPIVEEIKRQYNPSGHKVNDRKYRRDKEIKEEREVPFGMAGKTRKEKVTVRFEEVNRIALPLQRLIVKRAVSFLFANPVLLQCASTEVKEKEVFNALKTINFDNKVDGFNRRLAREVFTYKEAAEYWYPVEREAESDDYGFATSKRLRVALFSPANGDELYPYFDEHGDMIAFSREYTVTDENKLDHVYFDTYTDKEIYHYERSGAAGWILLGTQIHGLGKIPVVYVSQPQTEWDDVEGIIERLEKLLSNFAETNDYHASPKIFVNGKIVGFSKKAEAGAILEGEKDAKAQYLSWDHAPESVKLEIDTLIRFIYSMTQTPDISFESVKGLGNVSGVALKLLFMDAHLKGYEKIETFGEAIQRRCSIQEAYLGKLSVKHKEAAEKVKVVPTFNLFMIENDKDKIEAMVTANGSKPIISQKESVRLGGISSDPDEDYKQIQREAAEDKSNDIFN